MERNARKALSELRLTWVSQKRLTSKENTSSLKDKGRHGRTTCICGSSKLRDVYRGCPL